MYVLLNHVWNLAYANQLKVGYTVNVHQPMCQSKQHGDRFRIHACYGNPSTHVHHHS